MKFIATLLLAVSLLFPSDLFAVKPPGGFHRKVYKATLALSATSVQAEVDTPRFLCTVTAFEQVKGGYLLVGAGHCTPLNDDLYPDMSFFVSNDLDQPTHPVSLLKAELDRDGRVDYSIWYYPTKEKLPVIPLGESQSLHVGDKTYNVNFSLRIAKLTTSGEIASIEATQGDAKGCFIVNDMTSHGASGSAIVSEEQHKIIGILVAGWDGTNLGNAIVPVEVVTDALKHMNVDEYIRQVKAGGK